MLKRIILTIASISGGTLIIALIIFYFSPAQSVREFSSIAIYCSIVVALIGASMFLSMGVGGPAPSDEEYTRLMIARSHPEIDKADREDAERGGSLGLDIFGSGVFSGGIGVGLYYLAERGIIG